MAEERALRFEPADLSALALRRRLAAAERIAVVELFRHRGPAVLAALGNCRLSASLAEMKPTLDPVVAALRTLLTGESRHRPGRHRRAAERATLAPEALPRLIVEEARSLAIDRGMRFAPLETAASLLRQLPQSTLPHQLAEELFRRNSILRRRPLRSRPVLERKGYAVARSYSPTHRRDIFSGTPRYPCHSFRSSRPRCHLYISTR